MSSHTTNPPNSSRRTRRHFAGVPLAMLLVATACGDGAGDPTESMALTPSAADDMTDALQAEEPGVTTLPPATTPTTATAEPTTDEADTGCTAVSTGVTEFVLDAGGAEHDVQVYVPTAHDGSARLPLVMNFHGFGSTGDQQATFTGYEELAEHEGFIVVHPTAVPSSTDERGRNSWETLATDDPAKDDFAFTNELLDLLIEDYCVDASRVYATGMSGGGIFTSQLVCELSDRLAAAVSVAAIYFPASCDPAEAVPFMAIHGTDDPTVPFDGDLTGTRFETEAFAPLLFSTPIPDQFANFAEVMGCDPGGERVRTSTDVFTTTYSGCDDGVPVVFQEVVGGGHAWPSSPLTEPDSPVVEQLTELQGYSTFDIDATTDAWAFLEQHTRDV